ncbi:MAG: EamA family transporter [Calditrichaeota bacterium]|nr:MAG: EamA family transporter [Calditrichota bacterium]MBL1207280.1 EamA family transporter [Calditrichota bacterium]NOG47112.1 DMT family transporter [Calditrichota bacterium]
MLLGIMPVISNSRPMEISALNFALYLSIWQFIFSTPVLLIEYKSSNRGIFDAKLSSGRKKKTVLIILATGAMFGISTFSYVLSMEKAGTVSASIAIQAYPLFAILWETVFLNRKKNKSELFFTFLLIVGLYFLGTNGTWQIAGLSFWFIFAFSVPLIWSVAHVIIKEVLDKTPITPVQVTFFRVLISVIVIFTISISISGLNQAIDLIGNYEFQIYAAAMGFVYYIELIVWFYAVRQVDVSVASSIITPWPAITLILAIIFLHETIKSYQVVTLIIVFVSVYGIILSGKKKHETEFIKPKY